MTALCGLHPCAAWIERPDRQHRRGPWRDQNTEAIHTRPVLGPAPAVVDLLPFMRLVSPGAADLCHRGPGLLEAARRRLGAVVLRGLHRHGRRVHGGLSLDRDRHRAVADLSVRTFRGLRAGGESPFLSGLPASRIRFWCVTSGGCCVALYGIPTAYLLALWGSMLAARWFSFAARRHAERPRPFSSCGIWRSGYIGLAVFLLGLCIFCLMFSYRNAQTRGERNQVRWIMLASLIASVLIAYPARPGLDRSGDARPRQRRLADVRRIAALHDGLRLQHHALQADAGRSRSSIAARSTSPSA